MRTHLGWFVAWLALSWSITVSTSLATHDTVVVTAEDIEKLQPHSMADILNTIPGISAGSSSVTIHGNSKVKVLLDGRPLNDPTSSYGAIKWDMITPTDVAKIEILRGKGGVRYGQDSSGGVVLISSKGSTDISGTLKAFGGSQGRYSLNSSLQWVNLPFSGGLRGGYEINNGYQVNNDKKRYQGGASLGYSFEELGALRFSADYTHDERGYAGYPDYPTPFSRAEKIMQAYSLVGDFSRIKTKAYLNRGEKHHTDSSRGLDKTIVVDEYGLEMDSGLSLSTYGEISYGAAYYWSTAQGTSFAPQEESTISLYVIDTYTFSSFPISVSLGVRANINSGFDDAYNPEIKLTHTGDWLQTTLSYNRTNNTPSFYQRYNETATTMPNPALGMERADNFSVVFVAQLSETLSGSLTLFHNRLTDRITYTYGAGGTSSYQNVGTAAYSGGDVSFTWAPFEQFNAKLNYTFLDAKDVDTDLYLPTKSQHRGRVDLTFIPLNDLSIIFTGRGASTAYRDRANTTEVPEYCIFDYKMEYRFNQYSVFTQVTNIFNKEYLYVDGLLAPPRAWFVGVQVRM